MGSRARRANCGPSSWYDAAFMEIEMTQFIQILRQAEALTGN
jgi:hypothetical protein